MECVRDRTGATRHGPQQHPCHRRSQRLLKCHVTGNRSLDRRSVKVHVAVSLSAPPRTVRPMLAAYKITEKGLEPRPFEEGTMIPPEVTWIDLAQPTPAEDRQTEAFIGASIPTREESAEIEYSSRFYSEDNAVYMTASLLTGVDRGEPRLMPFTIVIAGDRIATVRYADFHAMSQFMARAGKPIGGGVTTPALF